METKMPQMASKLENEIGNLNENLMSLLASLHSGDYVDPAIDPKLVLDKSICAQRKQFTVPPPGLQAVVWVVQP